MQKKRGVSKKKYCVYRVQWLLEHLKNGRRYIYE